MDTQLTRMEKHCDNVTSVIWARRVPAERTVRPSPGRVSSTVSPPDRCVAPETYISSLNLTFPSFSFWTWPNGTLSKDFSYWSVLLWQQIKYHWLIQQPFFSLLTFPIDVPAGGCGSVTCFFILKPGGGASPSLGHSVLMAGAREKKLSYTY